MTASHDWGLIKAPDGGIAGVHSVSDKKPFKSGSFDEQVVNFDGAVSYTEWKFVYLPGHLPGSTLREVGGTPFVDESSKDESNDESLPTSQHAS
ncbi:MAG: hypothetical protein ACREUQ_11765 [Burkholderiales bacterium]